MKFAKIVFSTAGALGILAMIPMYLASGSYRYYGSLGGLVAWQFAFFVIATDPRRYRPMMIPALMEKLLWVLTLITVYLQGRMTAAEVAGGTIPHGLLGVLFVIAFFKTQREAPPARAS
jgi:hypothetical protein